MGHVVLTINQLLMQLEWKKWFPGQFKIIISSPFLILSVHIAQHPTCFSSADTVGKFLIISGSIPY